MSNPAFADASAEERAGWSAEMYRVHLADWIQWEMERSRETEHQLLFAGRIDEARIVCGKVTALEWLKASLAAPAPEPAAPTEEFTDPSAPPARKWRTKT